MKTLSKTHKDSILEMIKQKDNINWIKSYCKGAGFDTDKISSPVFVFENKITLRYRRDNSYYYINN